MGRLLPLGGLRLVEIVTPLANMGINGPMGTL